MSKKVNSVDITIAGDESLPKIITDFLNDNGIEYNVADPMNWNEIENYLRSIQYNLSTVYVPEEPSLKMVLSKLSPVGSITIPVESVESKKDE